MTGGAFELGSRTTPPATGRRRGNKAGGHAVFFGNQGVGRFVDRNDKDSEGLNLEFQVGQIGNVGQRLAQREIGQVDGHGLGGRRLVELQDNVDPAVRRVDRLGVEHIGTLPQILDGLAHRRIGEVDPGNDDFIQFAIDGLRSARNKNGLLDHRSGAEVRAPDGGLPGFVDLCDHGSTNVVVRVVAHPRFRHVDLLHTAAGGDVVAIKAEHCLVFGGCFVEASRVVKSLGFVEKCFDLLDLRDEAGSDRLVEVVGRFQSRKQTLSRFVVRIVLRLQEDADRFLRILPATFLDPRLGQAHDRLGKSVHGHGTQFADVGCVGQGVDRGFVLGVSGLVVALHEGDGSPLHGLRRVVVSQLHALGNLEFRLCLDTGKGGVPAIRAGIEAMG